jgi:subtilisin family serine protease
MKSSPPDRGTDMDALFCPPTPQRTLLRGFCLFIGLSLALAVFLATAPRPAAAGGKVFAEDALRASIQAKGFAKVLVTLNAPKAKQLADAAFTHKTITSGGKFSQETSKADKSLADYIHSMAQQVVSSLHSASYEVNRTYDYFPVIAMDVSGEALDALESSPQVSKIIEDRPIPLPAQSEIAGTAGTSSTFPCSSAASTDVDVVGAASAWTKGYTGAGWYVAILDSGVLTNHELFAGKNIVEACFSHTIDNKGACPNGQQEMYGRGAAKPFSSLYEGYDHGTHVAGIAAGNSGSVSGVAKDADIIAVQIFSPFSASLCAYDTGKPCVMTWDSDQLKALEYILSLRNTYNIAAVNMSLGGEQYSDQASCDSDPSNALMKDAIDQLRNAGIATVSVSGNDGSCNSMEAPGCISSAIGVGAVNDGDQEAIFNDWHYSMLDLLAPGIDIVSAVPDSPTLCEYLNGTSMAAPQVTGAWAILKQKTPSASVSDILYSLEGTGVPVHSLCSGINDYKPRINVGAALTPALIPLPSGQMRLDYTPTDSPVLNVQYFPYPIGVGPIAGSGDIINLRVGLYAFAAPVDIYVAVYAPAVDPDNYLVFTPGNKLKPFPIEGIDGKLVTTTADSPVPWKHVVTGPIDESLSGEIPDSQLPASTYYIYLLVTPPDRMDVYYLLSTSFVNSGS